MGAVRTSPGSIFTFYSYKGGTGRSMALANVACLLAQAQQKGNILMIDWDLEAPGLHRYFQNYIENSVNKSFAFDSHPGLIDLFYEMKQLCEQKQITNDDIPDSYFSEIKLEKYILKTSIRSLYLMSAGQLNEEYSSRVNGFNWEEFFNSYPSLMLKLSEYLSRKYNYVFIDSRTGHTDISGICTAIMPDKLVVVFTPNKQSIVGVIDITKMAVDYRKESDDLRQLLVFPLVSRVEPSEPQLRQDWRFGNKSKAIIGYQKQFESLFNDIYRLDKCDLTSYFDDVQIQYVPRYAYGEEVAVLIERSEDRLSLARSYESFAKQLSEKDRPWDSIRLKEPIPTVGTQEISDYKIIVVKEIQNQRSSLKNKSIQETFAFLNQIGYYYEQIRPSNIEYSFILETEALLNDLYIKSLKESETAYITTSLLNALGQAGSLATAVKNNSFGADFVKTAKQLGRTLIRISQMK